MSARRTSLPALIRVRRQPTAGGPIGTAGQLRYVRRSPLTLRRIRPQSPYAAPASSLLNDSKSSVSTAPVPAPVDRTPTAARLAFVVRSPVACAGAREFVGQDHHRRYVPEPSLRDRLDAPRFALVVLSSAWRGPATHRFVSPTLDEISGRRLPTERLESAYNRPAAREVRILQAGRAGIQARAGPVGDSGASPDHPGRERMFGIESEIDMMAAKRVGDEARV